VKSLQNSIKVVLLHPQQRQTFTEILTSTRIQTEKIFSKKDSKKLVRFENGCYICTPQNIGKFIDRLVGLRGKKEIKFSKKNFKKHLPVRNKFSTFAPALRNKSKQHK